MNMLLGEGKIIKFPDLKAQREANKPEHPADQLDAKTAERLRDHKAAINTALDALERLRESGATNDSRFKSPTIMARRSGDLNAVQALFFSLPRLETGATTWSRTEAFAAGFVADNYDRISKAIDADVRKLESYPRAIKSKQARHVVEKVFGDEIIAWKLIKQQLRRVAELLKEQEAIDEKNVINMEDVERLVDSMADRALNSHVEKWVRSTLRRRMFKDLTKKMKREVKYNPERHDDWVKRAIERGDEFHWFSPTIEDNRVMEQAVDYINSLRPTRQVKMSYEQAVEGSREWHRRLREERGKNRYPGGHDDKGQVKEFLKCAGGLTWYSLTGANALANESSAMGHCVGESPAYLEMVQKGEGLILSLRDKKGSHVTVEWRHKRGISQVKGKGNHVPVERYVPAVEDLVEKMYKGQSFSWLGGTCGDLISMGFVATVEKKPMRLQTAVDAGKKVGQVTFASDETRKVLPKGLKVGEFSPRSTTATIDDGVEVDTLRPDDSAVMVKGRIKAGSVYASGSFIIAGGAIECDQLTYDPNGGYNNARIDSRQITANSIRFDGRSSAGVNLNFICKDVRAKEMIFTGMRMLELNGSFESQRHMTIAKVGDLKLKADLKAKTLRLTEVTLGEIKNKISAQNVWIHNCDALSVSLLIPEVKGTVKHIHLSIDDRALVRKGTSMWFPVDAEVKIDTGGKVPWDVRADGDLRLFGINDGFGGSVKVKGTLDVSECMIDEIPESWECDTIIVRKVKKISPHAKIRKIVNKK